MGSFNSWGKEKQGGGFGSDLCGRIVGTRKMRTGQWGGKKGREKDREGVSSNYGT